MFWKPNLSHRFNGLNLMPSVVNSVDESQAASTVCDDYPNNSDVSLGVMLISSRCMGASRGRYSIVQPLS
jgi:hypothetical protein